jgi:hypothetical protein
MAAPQLVAMPRGPQDANPIVIDVPLGDRAVAQDRDGLARHGSLVLHSGVADGGVADAEVPAQATEQFSVRDVDLLDPQVDVFAGVARLVERDLLDDEILGALLEHAADAGLAGDKAPGQRIAVDLLISKIILGPHISKVVIENPPQSASRGVKREGDN